MTEAETLPQKGVSRILDAFDEAVNRIQLWNDITDIPV
jgi:hypothetical protein